jgi:hypothetical protein
VRALDVVVEVGGREDQAAVQRLHCQIYEGLGCLRQCRSTRPSQPRE